MAPKKKVNLYTDGACLNNPGPGGWGVILDYNGILKELSGGESATTNNRMELTAAIEGLSALKEPCDVTLYSDSSYLVNAFKKGWVDKWQGNSWRTSGKKDVLNTDLWQKLISLISVHDVTFVWLKGHAGHEQNERCDLLATQYAKKLKSNDI